VWFGCGSREDKGKKQETKGEGDGKKGGRKGLGMLGSR
jgi:hypothetical protein